MHLLQARAVLSLGLEAHLPGVVLVVGREVGEGVGGGGGEGRRRGGWDVLNLCMAVIVCVTIDPRIPTMPGRSKSGFNQPDRHCLHQARSAVRCSAISMKSELHPSKNRS